MRFIYSQPNQELRLNVRLIIQPRLVTRLASASILALRNHVSIAGFGFAFCPTQSLAWPRVVLEDEAESVLGFSFVRFSRLGSRQHKASRPPNTNDFFWIMEYIFSYPRHVHDTLTRYLRAILRSVWWGWFIWTYSFKKYQTGDSWMIDGYYSTNGFPFAVPVVFFERANQLYTKVLVC